MERKDDFGSSLRKMQQQTNFSADNEKHLDMGKKWQNSSSSWVGLPDLNQNIMAEIARRRNVTNEFDDDIFKGKCKDTTSTSASKNLDQSPTKQICSDGLVSSKADDEYPTFGEKAKRWKEETVKVGGKSKHGEDSGIKNGEGEDRFGYFVIEFGSDTKNESN